MQNISLENVCEGKAMNYKFAICDDEITELKYLSSLLTEWAKQRGHILNISTFESAESYLFDYAENKDYDIILLDIEMNGKNPQGHKMNGVELAKVIREYNNKIQIIFITGFPDYIVEGYEVAALHYLMKPVNETKLFSVLDRACINLNKPERAVMLDIGGETVRIKTGEIISVEAFGHSVMVQTGEKNFKAKIPISAIEKLLGEGFIRCHRSYIIGLKYAKRITKTEVILDNNKSVPLSRNSYKKVNQAFINYYKGAD